MQIGLFNILILSFNLLASCQDNITITQDNSSQQNQTLPISSILNFENKAELPTEIPTEYINIEGTSEQMQQELAKESEQFYIKTSQKSVNVNEDEWQTHMYDFMPEEILNFKILDSSQQNIYQTIEHVPSLIRGAYFVSNDDNALIDLSIEDPHGQKLLSWTDKHEGIFFFNATLLGEFKITFNNKRFSGDKIITLAYHVKNQQLMKKDVKTVETKIMEQHFKFKEMMSANKLLNRKKQTHYKTLLKTHKRILGFTIFETIAIMITTSLQIYYIKQMLENKLVS